MRILLFSGKGGVGKTSVAAALAKAGVPLPEAIEMSAASTNNSIFEERLVVVRDTLLWVLNDMTRAGVEIYKLDRMLHMKLGVFDGKTTIVGSDNLSGSNLAESVAVVTDPRFTRVVQARIFDVDLPKPSAWSRTVRQILGAVE